MKTPSGPAGTANGRPGPASQPSTGMRPALLPASVVLLELPTSAGLTMSACRTKSRRWGCSLGGLPEPSRLGHPSTWSRAVLKQVFLEPQMDG